MNFKDRSDYAAFARAMFWCIVLSGAVILCMVNLKEVGQWLKDMFYAIAPITIAFGVAYVLNRPYSAVLNFFETKAFKRKCGFATACALFTTYASALGVVTLFLLYIIPAFIESAEDFTSVLPQYYWDVRNFIESFTTKLNISSESLANFMFDSSEMLDNFMNMLVNYRGEILTTSVQIVRTFINIITGVIASIYMLGSKPRILRRFNIIVTSITTDETKRNAYKLFNQANRAFSGYIFGRLIDAIIIGIICYIAFLVFKLPYPILLAVICGVTNFVPVFGPLIGAIIAGTVVLIVSPASAIKFFIIVIVVQTFDGNLLGPKLLGKTMGMASVWVVIAITLLGGLFGFWGMVLGVPLFGVAYSLFEMIVKVRADKRQAQINESGAEI